MFQYLHQFRGKVAPFLHETSSRSLSKPWKEKMAISRPFAVREA